LLPAFGRSSLSCPYSLLPDGFTSFHLPSGVLFSFHSRYYFAIGLGECLGFGVHAPGLPTEFPIRRTLCSGITLVPSTTGLSPSSAPCSKGLRIWTVGWTRAPHLHAVDPHGFGLPCSVFDRLYSRNHDCFLFLCLLRCFNSAGYLSHKANDLAVRRSHSAIPGSSAPCAYPW
jgi:hypothetical protein